MENIHQPKIKHPFFNKTKHTYIHTHTHTHTHTHRHTHKDKRPSPERLEEAGLQLDGGRGLHGGLGQSGGLAGLAAGLVGPDGGLQAGLELRRRPDHRLEGRGVERADAHEVPQGEVVQPAGGRRRLGHGVLVQEVGDQGGDQQGQQLDPLWGAETERGSLGLRSVGSSQPWLSGVYIFFKSSRFKHIEICLNKLTQGLSIYA